jgi:hypothetical protein
MRRIAGVKGVLLLPASAAISLALGGCVAAMAASAVSMAATAAGGHPQSNEGLKPQALSDCSNRATQYGKIHIIDVEQHSTNKIIVWGTVDDGKQKRSFECDYGTTITGFKLRQIEHPTQS